MYFDVYFFYKISTVELQYDLLMFFSTDESEATTSFLTQLSTWDREELDEKLVNRVQVSKRAVAKVVQAFDRLHQRNDKVARALKGEALEIGT